MDSYKNQLQMKIAGVGFDHDRPKVALQGERRWRLGVDWPVAPPSGDG
jgi:hypothetical protein